MRYLLLILWILAFKANAIDVKTYIPEKAYIYAPVLRTEQLKYWKDHYKPEVLAGLAEQESCLSLKHSKCWDPSAKLSTPRELGGGVGQITKAYKKDGTVRFDALQELKDKHPVLGELNWGNIYVRPDLQIAALIIKNKDNWNSLFMVKDPLERLRFTDASYNGGLGGVQNERRACGLRKGCDPQKWFGNVENTCLKSNEALYGTRSPCFINREHVTNVFLLRSDKYKPFFK